MKIVLGGLLFAAALGMGRPVHALESEYPSRPIKIIVPNPPGGANDILARIIGETLRERWGQPVIIDNRPGAAGNIGAEVVFRAPPDGYTLLITTPAPLVSNKSLYAKLAYSPDEFTPVSVIVASPNLLVVGPQVAATDIKQLIALATANPDRLNYATQGAGTGAHLTAELFKSTAGVNIVHIPYKGTSPALAAMFSGEVDMMFVAFGDALQYVIDGKLRALAVGSDKRNPLLPDVPTMSETLPGFVSIFWQGMVASPGTPPEIATKLSTAIAEVLKRPDIAKRLRDMSIQGVGSTPAEMALFMRQESARWGTVIKSIGATAE
jgi:tripartite-type tricarboxylate transporter receptor subunit TctC